MIKLEKNTKQTKIQKNIIIFDLDGVLIDSKKNMQISWGKVQQKFNLNNILFNNYFAEIGKPFYDILDHLGIFKNKKKIKETFDQTSIKNKKQIKFYYNVIKELKTLRSLNYKLCIVTSKDKVRTTLVIKKIEKLFTYIQCPQVNLKGKPYPDQILNLIKKLRIKKNQCIYVGDTYVDFMTAKNAKIDFIFAEWGYGKKNNCYINSAKNITDLRKKLISKL